MKSGAQLEKIVLRKCEQNPHLCVVNNDAHHLHHRHFRIPKIHKFLGEKNPQLNHLASKIELSGLEAIILVLDKDISILGTDF